MYNRFRGKKIILIPLFAISFLALFSFIVMQLWNNVLANVVHVSTVNFWQALGILVLAKILFGGFRGGHWGRHRWNKQMQQKWMNMTPEEREKFKAEWRTRCGGRFTEQKPAESQA
ncbi:MAG: hypothetical protein ACHQEM_11225 [Chitinophagales bacterium]